MTVNVREKVAVTDMEWTAEEEIHLFFALDGLRPVGINKHFHMVCIADRLSRSLNREIPAETIWRKLHSMYNLTALEKQETVQFPDEEFSLPDAEFLALKKRNEMEDKRSNIDSDGSVSSSGPPSIIALSTDNTTKDKSVAGSKTMTTGKDTERKMSSKPLEVPKRVPKRTRGSMSLESSPSTTPPPLPSNKRRRI